MHNFRNTGNDTVNSKQIDMKLEMQSVLASNCPVDVFVYNEETNHFFFVDDTDKEYEKVTLYHEPSPDPATWIKWELEPDTVINVVKQYNVTPETLFD